MISFFTGYSDIWSEHFFPDDLVRGSNAPNRQALHVLSDKSFAMSLFRMSWPYTRRKWLTFEVGLLKPWTIQNWPSTE